ncbi:MAG: hypothetical protein GC192_10600 [Bacteroidetes bacterium]|nr:hypothetical protein [Bacteroidota bacterium]
MKGNTLLLMFLIVLISGTKGFAQKTSIDVVKMKDGSTLTGKLMQYSPGSILRIELLDGTMMEVADENVANIQQGVEVPKEEVKRLPAISSNQSPIIAKTHGFYAISMLSFAAGGSDNEGLSLGAGFSQVFGYQLLQYLGVGAGIGVDNYSRRGETVYPLFGEVRSYLPSKKSTGNFYVLAAGGYAFAFPRKHLDITHAEGGLMGHFALGYRAATTEGLDIYVDIGPKFQSAYYERQLYNSDVEIRSVDYQRIVIRVGLGLWK